MTKISDAHDDNIGWNALYDSGDGWHVLAEDDSYGRDGYAYLDWNSSIVIDGTKTRIYSALDKKRRLPHHNDSVLYVRDEVAHAIVAYVRNRGFGDLSLNEYLDTMFPDK